MDKSILSLFLFSIFLFLLIPSINARSYANNEIIVKFKEGRIPTISVPSTKDYAATSLSSIDVLNSRYQITSMERFGEKLGLNYSKYGLDRYGLDRYYLLKSSRAINVEQAVLNYRNDPNIESAEPNSIIQVDSKFPNDIHFPPISWSLYNPWFNLRNSDIAAPEAWDITTGSPDVVVAVIDSGINYTHNDLMDNMWSNPKEWYGDVNRDGCPGWCHRDDDDDGLVDEDSHGCSRDGYDKDWKTCTYLNDISEDDDENGLVDDIFGWDFTSCKEYKVEVIDENERCIECLEEKEWTNDPMDDYGHGTFVAGIIGAVGNNGRGIVGVNWNVKIMPLKFMNYQGCSRIEDEAYAIIYATAIMHVPITSNSYGSKSYSNLEYNVMQWAEYMNSLFVASAGNDGEDTDAYPHYPSSYNLPNIISVAATNSYDELAGFSNYGTTSVDLGAPGVGIFSYFIEDPQLGERVVLGERIVPKSGTSAAAPHVAGVAALLKSIYPDLDYRGIKGKILYSVDHLPALEGKTLTEGRLNAFKALTTSFNCNLDGTDLNGLCNKYCSVDPRCNGRKPESNWLEGSIRNVCNLNCEYYETFIGDINLDTKVDIVDLAIVARAFRSTYRHPKWDPTADIDGNDRIDILDITRVAKDFGKTSSQFVPTENEQQM